MIVTKPFLDMTWLSAFWELTLNSVSIFTMRLNTKPDQLPSKIHIASFKERAELRLRLFILSTFCTRINCSGAWIKRETVEKPQFSEQS